jgi:hypothetical protein
MTPNTRGVPADVKNCSPSARLVYLLLDAEGALAQQQIRSLAGISEDTTRRVLEELGDVDAVLERPHPGDGRCKKYILPEKLEVT